MKEKRNKGMWLRLVSGLFVLIVPIILVFRYIELSNPEKMYADGKAYEGQVDSDMYAVKVTGMLQGGIEIINQKEEIHVFEYQRPNDSYGLVGVEINPDDELLKELTELFESDEDKAKYITMEIIVPSENEDDTIKNYSEDMRENMQDFEWAEYLDYDTYASVSEAEEDKLLSLIFAGEGILLGIGLIIRAFIIRRNNGRTYEELYEIYPELQHQLDLLQTDSTYHHEKMGIVLYKKHLIVYKRQFKAVDLQQIIKLYHRQINHRRMFITVARDSYLMAENTDHKVISLPIKNIGKFTDAELQGLFTCVSTEFPNIMLGY
ncbi:MAG: hypothetical protein Q4B80_05990 [Aerococcaceae bacterium]|nr:hypothetical protein [Aerococcaceae bacterium]